MKMLYRVGVFLAVFCLVLPKASFASEDEQSLFVNLSSDDINRAAMAIGFSTKIRTQKKIPVTIFLNVEAVRIADKSIKGHQHVSGKTLKEMLAVFMKAGGRVVICPMCMNAVGGLEKDDLIDGVLVGGPNVTWPALFADDTVVLSY